MSEKYVWCKDLPVVDYKDEEGNEYCIFHAPRGKKGMSVEMFNEEVFKRINEVKYYNSISRNEKNCNLSGAIFEGNIDFTRYNSLPPVDFSFAKFNGEVIFLGVTFNEWVTFLGATFTEGASFPVATFKGRAEFSGSNFLKWVDFSEASFCGEAYFTASEFREKAYFSDAIFTHEVCFVEEIFIKGGDFSGVKIKEKGRFEKVNLQKASFLDTDLRMIDFINCKWPEGKNGRRVLYDEIELFKNKEESKNFKEEIKKVEILYRLLKQKYKEEHNEFEVSNWHYGEKEMQRKSSIWKSFSFYLLHLYWLSSGYGERPVRAGIALFLLIIALSILFGITGIKSITANSSVIKINEWPAGIWNLDYLKATIEYATFESKPIFVSQNWFLKIAAKLLIPLQAALFALALRNRFRR